MLLHQAHALDDACQVLVKPASVGQTGQAVIERELMHPAVQGNRAQSLAEAIDALETDEVVKDGIGADLAREFITIKRMEWTEYSRHVSGWETSRYLEMF